MSEAAPGDSDPAGGVDKGHRKADPKTTKMRKLLGFFIKRFFVGWTMTDGFRRVFVKPV